MDRLITFKTAELAKDKGLKRSLDINGYLLGYSLKNEKPYPSGYKVFMSFPSEDKWLFAPTQSTLSNWLREEHNIHIWASCKTNDDGKTIFIPHGRTIPDTIKNRLVVDIIPYSTHNTYEQAIEEALVEALNLI